MREAIEIGIPRLSRNEDKRVRLEAAMSLASGVKKLFFETAEEWAEYFVTDRLDAFVLMLLPCAMAAGQDIMCRGPVSRELLEKLNDTLIPALARFTERYHRICVHAEPAGETVRSEPFCATGFSGGLDSMYTVYMLKDRIEGFRYLTTFDAGVYEHKQHVEELLEAEQTTAAFAEQIGMSCRGIFCNITELVEEHYRSVVCFRIFSCALAMGKAWNRYVYSPGRIAVQNIIREEAAESALPLILYACSTHYLKFLQYGAYQSREEKIQALSGAPDVFRDHIHVCLRDYVFGRPNCCYCSKCAAFLTKAELLGTADAFAKAFPLEEFRKNRLRIAASRNTLRSDEERLRMITKEEDADVLEKAYRQMDAVKAVIDKNRGELTQKARGNDLV